MVADAIRRVHAWVAGDVQGVWFRKGAQHTSRRLGLTGWVRNLPDGRVELEAEGPSSDIDDLLVWLRVGPPSATVEVVNVTDVPATHAERTFEVRS